MENLAVPAISVQEVARKLQAGETFFLLDVREMREIDRVALPVPFLEAPLSALQAMGKDALPAEIQDDNSAEIVVFCHHGGRSMQVAMWLKENGWTNISNMTGGIHAYAVQIDPSIGTY